MNKKKPFRLIWFPIFGILIIAGFATREAAAQHTQPPHPPVIFLHYDYMAPRWWDPSSGNFAPDPDAIDRVVEAFRKHGITLVIDPQHTEIPYTQKLYMMPFGGLPCVPTVCADFYALKEQYFHPKGNQKWHYAIFGDFGYDLFGGPEPVNGLAELGGDDFMVTFRQLDRLFPNPNRTPAMFMHELGHNLGLQHGGDEEQNYKINYMSVMNYQFSLGIPYMAPDDTYQFGIWAGQQPPPSEGEHIAGRRLDYSSGDNATLDETHLDESIGIGGPETSNDVTFYWSCGSPLVQPCILGYIRVAAAPIDWNNNGVIETDVAADLNNYYPNANSDLILTEMRDFDDWSYIHQFLRTPRYVTGTLRPLVVK